MVILSLSPPSTFLLYSPPLKVKSFNNQNFTSSFSALSAPKPKKQPSLLPQNPLHPFTPLTKPLTPASASASASASDGEHWTAQYRRRLGIGDSPVVIRAKKEWEPPIPGVVKINYTTAAGIGENDDGSCMEDRRTGEKVQYFCFFHALARNALGGVLGFTVGHVPNFRQKDRMGLHLYALRGMGNLIRELRDQGIYDGPFVIESNTDFEEITKCLGVEDPCCNAAEGEALIRGSMPEDLEVVDARCKIHVGDPDEMMKVLEGSSKKLEDSGVVVNQTKSGYQLRRTKSSAGAGYD